MSMTFATLFGHHKDSRGLLGTECPLHYAYGYLSMNISANILVENFQTLFLLLHWACLCPELAMSGHCGVEAQSINTDGR